MRINGTNNFLSEIRKSPLTQLLGTEAQVHVAQPSNLNKDTVDISDAGKKLRLNTRKKAEEANPLPEWAQKADRALSQTIDIFERMHELATLAQDKKLTDLERADMQIEIETLRGTLMAMPTNLQTGGGLTRLPNIRVSLAMGAGDYSQGDYSNVLGRMRARIANGEEWNVREAYATREFTRVKYDDNGDEVWEVVAGEAWHVVGDENILTRDDDGKIVSSDRKVQTVREILERTCPVVVMDVESAAAGAKYLEKQIDTVQKYREHLAANFNDMGIEGVDYFLTTLVFPDGDIGRRDLLLDPTFASAFLFSEGIGDSSLERRTLLELEFHDGRDISPTDKENIDEENIKDVRISLSNLSKEPMIGNVELKEPKIIEIKGISVKK